MKITYTKVLSRKFLLVFAVFIIILSVTALIVRSSVSHKANQIAKLAKDVNLDQSRPQQALLLVHQAEDEFQESLLNTDTGKIRNYKSKLSQAIGIIDSLLNEKPDTSALTTVQYKQVHYWYNQKLKLSDQLYLLKHSFDSLLTAFSKPDTSDDKNLASVNLTHHFKQTKNSVHSDTLNKGTAHQKKGLLARLKDAIANKSNSSANTVEINHHHSSKTIDDETSKIIARDKNAFAKKLQLLQQHNIKVLSTQKNLVSLNIHLSNELENIINQEKEINFNLQNEFNQLAIKSYHDTNTILNTFFLIALFLLLAFAALLIVFILKLDKSEILLLEENKRAVGIAQQKMDLLLHMSHEIRNPLTSIQGFLYIFRKKPLTDRQAEMLDSIKLSSDMLLQTLNDTLDAAKMESSEFKINNDPFNPDLTLKEVIESMAFSAAKKNLILDYNFEGNGDVILLGDAFRLKQVMVNLLSNAIKYTKIGSVKVKATLVTVKGASGLQVDIIDTGEGISADQQVNLFSKFYQTNSAKGKTGTGLGLFICKELIQAQGGHINVKSQVDKGSVFTFFIPYAEYTTTADYTIDDPLTLLNGLKVLAVDDNELNLMLLKMLSNKWNVKLYQAPGGKEALEILAKQEIAVVLTDIQMPEMDGNELMEAIRQLKSPQNKIPVIAMTGEMTDKEEFSKKGFSGQLTKPFTEQELLKQIIAVIRS